MYIKLCKEVDGKLVSAATYPSWALQYRCGKKTVPKIGKIFVFECAGDARRFEAQCELFGLVYLEVEAEGVVPAVYMASMTNEFEGFWSGELPQCLYTHAPQGTMFADSVTPIRRLNRFQRKYRR